MRHFAVAAGVVATIVVGLWATTVLAWIEHFDSTNFNE